MKKLPDKNHRFLVYPVIVFIVWVGIIMVESDGNIMAVIASPHTYILLFICLMYIGAGLYKIKHPDDGDD